MRTLKKGFTLLELLIVIVIIGLLVSLVSINVLPSLNQAYLEKTKADISRIEQALVMFKINEGTYPSQVQGLESLVIDPGDLKRPLMYPQGGYINRLPKDPWGNDYLYVYPGTFNTYDVLSLGADGQPGGEGENKDIGNFPE
ncbi:MAG: type II secretion system protein GspG [Rickettsiales bacterium]|nr:type II secretion system protein GspG [Rickettsiales bacterium]|tara:strand:+ start:1874 stop:2299 length:426 start_codon:yes stop_codon:yes gene_type:complete